MSALLEEALAKITAQQPKGRTPVWMCGEQLKDILRQEPELVELVSRDLEQEAMSIVHCEKKIRAFADAHKTGNFSCVSLAEAERIIREFYGLHGGAVSAPPVPEMRGGAGIIDLSDFM